MIAPRDNNATPPDREKRQRPANPFADAPVIFSYSRKQAIADGVLIDLSAWAKEVGFIVPVACTAEVWHQYVVPPDTTRPLGQSERGRAHDMLWVLRWAIRRTAGPADHVRFRVVFLTGPGRRETVKIEALSGPGDQGEPVITILQPHED